MFKGTIILYIFIFFSGSVLSAPGYHSYEDYPASEKCGHFMIYDHKQNKCVCEPEDSYESHGPLIYHKQTDQCYLPNTRAYCQEGELLQKTGKCQKVDKPTKSTRKVDYDYHDIHVDGHYYDHYD